MTARTAVRDLDDARRPSLLKRTVLLGLTAVQLSLQAATWVSLARRDARAINGPKWFWFLASFINFIGPAAYLLGGRKLHR